MTIKFEVNDYLLVQLDKNPSLILVSNVGKEVSKGIIESTLVDKTNTVVEFNPSTVLSNLGPSPKQGKYLGVEVEPYYRSFETAIGYCDVYYKPEMEGKEFRATVREAASEVHDILEKLLLADKFAPVQFEMRLPKGKRTTGYWKNQAGRGELDIICVRPDKMELMGYVLMHEFGHPMYESFSNKVKRHWIEKYHSAVELFEVNHKECKALLSGLQNFDDMLPSEYAGQLEEEEVPKYKACLAWIKKHHGLRPVDLDVLHLTSGKLSLDDIWPVHITTSEMQVLVTEYSKKNSSEFFCESLANLYYGKVTPDIKELVLKSVKTLV